MCDQRARILAPEARSAIVSYLSIEETRDKDSGNVRINFGKGGLHPSLERAKKVVDKYFKFAVREHDFLNNPNIVKVIQNYLPKAAADAFTKKEGTSSEKWKFLKTQIGTDKHLLTSLKFRLAYPRLDMEVSKQMNHLLKSPFVIHPGTGKISVPIDASNLESFDLSKVPTVYQVMNEQNESVGQNSILQPFIKSFKSMVLSTSIGSSLENKNKMDMSW